MKLHYLPSFSFFFFFFLFLVCFAQSRSEANPLLSAEEYWKSVLPNTPIPKSVQELLQPADTGNKSNFPDQSCQRCSPAPSNAYQYSKTYSRTAGRLPSRKFGKIVGSNTTFFFLYKELHPGKRMNLVLNTEFPKRSRLLPRQVANSIPFSSNSLPKIMNQFAINTTSMLAYFMQQTINECEAPAIKGEDKSCPTSLESLVDYGVSKLGRNVMILSSEIEKENQNNNKKKEKEYKLLTGIKMVGDKQMVCHRRIYAYAVFFCHTLSATKAYTVRLLGSDGTKAKAVVICHYDTSDWNPNHIAFELVNVKPGGPPICHFLNTDAMVWILN